MFAVHELRKAISLVALLMALGALVLPATAGAFVYWANGGGTTIGRANLNGSGVNQSFITGATAPCGVALDGSHVYWANGGGTTIGRANLDGSEASETFITGATAPCGVAVDGSHVYWANGGGTTIGRANLDGSEASETFIIGATAPCGVAVDGSHVYWANGGGTTIGRANLDGSEASETFITGASAPCGVAVDGSHVYWANGGGTTIGRARLDGSGVSRSFITGTGAPCGVAVDSFPHATRTTIACARKTVTFPASTTCKARVTDTTAAPTVPRGMVTLSSGGAGSLTPSSSCVLAADSSRQSTCQFIFTPAASVALTASIAGAYSGDPTHTESHGSATLLLKPTSAFTLIRLRVNRRRGTATFTLRVPGASTLVLRGKGIRRRVRIVKRAGRVRLFVRAARKAARTLARTGRVRVRARLTFTALGGAPRTKLVKVRLVRRP